MSAVRRDIMHMTVIATVAADGADLVLAHAIVEGGIPGPDLAVGAEAGDQDPTLLAVLAPGLRGGPGLAHPGGLGLDHDPDLGLPLMQGADQVLLGDPGLVLQAGAFANLKRHLKNKVAPLLKALAEAGVLNEMTEDPSAIFFSPQNLSIFVHICLELNPPPPFT